MTGNAENLVLGLLKQIQSEMSAFRGRFDEVITRLGYIEHAIDRLSSFGSDTSGRITATRAALDKLTARVERVERRLEGVP